MEYSELVYDFFYLNSTRVWNYFLDLFEVRTFIGGEIVKLIGDDTVYYIDDFYDVNPLDRKAFIMRIDSNEDSIKVRLCNLVSHRGELSIQVNFMDRNQLAKFLNYASQNRRDFQNVEFIDYSFENKSTRVKGSLRHFYKLTKKLKSANISYKNYILLNRKS